MAELLSSSKGGNKNATLRFDLTAMVDLAFLLVTFFMLTATLSKPRAMDLAMPAGSATDGVPASRTLTLCLGRNQLLWYKGLLDHQAAPPKVIGYSAKSLRATLFMVKREIESATGKNVIVVVKPGMHSSYGNLVSTLDELNIAQINTYAIAGIDAREIALLKARQIF